MTAQTKQARPAFEVASVKAIDGFIRDHEGQQLTATTFFDRTDLLQLIARAYLDASGTGVCYMKMTFQASTMRDVADSLTTYLDRPVVDRTGVDGEFEFTITYEPDPDAPSNIGRLPVNPGLNPSRAAVALDDVGLKLESSTTPFEVLVIARVERPSSN